MELTNTNIRYLLTIYDLSKVRLEVSSKDIARSLAVSRASVTSMMSILIDKRLVDKERYGKIHLTGLGRTLARDGTTIAAEDIYDSSAEKGNVLRGPIIAMLQKS